MASSVTVEVPFSRLDFSAGWHESVCLLHYTAGKVANASLLLSVIRVLYTASPEEVPSVLQHCINIDKLPLSDGDEPAVSRVVILQRTSYQDRVAAFRVSAEFLVGEFRHLSSSIRGWQ